MFSSNNNKKPYFRATTTTSLLSTSRTSTLSLSCGRCCCCCCTSIRLISFSVCKTMSLFFLLLGVVCLLGPRNTEQFQLNEYMQMMYQQPYRQLMAAAAAANYQTPFQNSPLLNQHYSRQQQQQQQQRQQPTYDFAQPTTTTNANDIYKQQVLTRLHRNVHSQRANKPERAHINNNNGNRLHLAQLLNDDPTTTSSNNGNNHQHQHHHRKTTSQRNKLLKLDGVESSPSMNSMLRNINPAAAHQLILAENNYPSGGGIGAGMPATSSVAAAMAAINGVVENPGAAVAMNLIDSPDVVDDNGGGGGGGVVGGGGLAGGHFDYSYQSPSRLVEHHQAPQFTPISTGISNHHHHQNSTMALYRLLNLIDQSVPAISMPFQNSKTSSNQQALVGGGGGGLTPPPPMAAYNFDDSSNYNYNYNGSAVRSAFNNYHNHHNNNNNSLNSHRHQTLASQQTSSSPNANFWSRKRNQMHWRQAGQYQHPLADYGAGGGGGSGSGAGADTTSGQTGKQQHSSLIDNSIEVQPAALKLIKASHQSSYLNTPTTSTHSRRANHSQSSSSSPSSSSYNNNHHNGFYQQHNGHGHGHQHHHQQNNNLSSQAIGARNNNNNANLNQPNSMKNDNDIGFGSKQQQQQTNNNNNNNNNSNYNSEKLNGALTSSSSSNSKLPHDADSEMIAANNAPRCDKFTPDICVDDFEYPEQAIIDEIQKKRDVFELMYSEVKDNEPLVDGIPRDVEESYNYDYYYYGKTNLSQAASQPSPTSSSSSSSSSSSPSSSNSVGAGLRLSPPILSHLSKNQREVDSQSTSRADVATIDDLDGPLASSISAAASSIDGMDALIGATPQASNPSASSQSPPTTGFICPSEVMYGKPKLAKNKKGLWKVIVNAGEFTQTVRLEKCLLPNKKCNYVSAQSYESRCAQVHSHHRLLVFEKGRGFYIDTFRLPTGCNCHVTRKSFMPSSSSSSSTTTSSGGGGGRREGSSSSASDMPASRQQAASNQGVDSPGANQMPFYQFGGRTSSPSGGNERSSSESMLSQTLWSILSGGGGGGGNGGQLSQSFNLASQFDGGSGNGNGGNAAGSGNSNNRNVINYNNNLNLNSHMDSSSNTNNLFERPTAQREAYQSQSLILEHLSQNPALAANISDSVLRQLIDVGQINTNFNQYNHHHHHQNQPPPPPNGQAAAASQPFSVAPQPVPADNNNNNNNNINVNVNSNINNMDMDDARQQQQQRGAQLDCSLCEPQLYHSEQQQLGAQHASNGQHYTAAAAAAATAMGTQQQSYECANACARAPFAHARQPQNVHNNINKK